LIYRFCIAYFSIYSVGKSSGSEILPFFSSVYQAPAIKANITTIEMYKAFGIGGGSPAPYECIPDR